MGQFLKIINFVEGAFAKRFEDLNASLDLHYEANDEAGSIDQFILEQQLGLEEILLMFLALMPRIDPSVIHRILLEYVGSKSDAPHVGGIRGKNHRGVLPNGELALFLVGGLNYELRNEFEKKIVSRSKLFENQIVEFKSVEPHEPPLSGVITVQQDWYNEVVLGQIQLPKLSPDFPAQLIETNLDWSDLVVAPRTVEAINEIKLWLEFNDELMTTYGMKRLLKPGYRALFYGPPGVGKTLAVSLLGKHINRPVFRVDLSMVVSKYIGETEKNLAALFNKAESKDWILFFDEADAIFGKRTQVKDAHDKYANQEVSYLLQRVEGFNGLVILASNFKSNVDIAFARRFQSFVEFDMPIVEQRAELWNKLLPKNLQLESFIDLENIAHKYSINGANILNAVQYASVKALSRDKINPIILQDDLVRGIVKELKKEGKV